MKQATNILVGFCYPNRSQPKIILIIMETTYHVYAGFCMHATVCSCCSTVSDKLNCKLLEMMLALKLFFVICLSRVGLSTQVVPGISSNKSRLISYIQCIKNRSCIDQPKICLHTLLFCRNTGWPSDTNCPCDPV